jgi:O-antigen/teichoic acid export membrane protein
VVAIAQDVIRLIASRPAYLAAYQIVPWVILGFFARGYYFVFVTALYYSKKLQALSLITMSAAAINVMLNLTLIPHLGYRVAAVTTFVAYALQAVAMYFFAQRAYRLRYESGRLARLTLLGIVWAAALYSFSLSSLWLDLALKTCLSLCYPVGLLALRFFSSEEVDSLRHIRQRAIAFLS